MTTSTTCRTLQIFTTSGRVTEDGDWNPATKSVWETKIELDELGPAATVKEVAEAAADQIERAGCDNEYSSHPDWQPNGWYSAETYTNPYSGDREEKTLHLKGFSEAESREIHRRLFGRR
ncbi:hypothetical protein ACFY05_33050 [Microtetraspora fusca]|uniref:Uncharacterized protein n=1 Tax=Microtetraspora fusca TaxID=1997 RepID=A0ABW6VHR4_MICFU